MVVAGSGGGRVYLPYSDGIPLVVRFLRRLCVLVAFHVSLHCFFAVDVFVGIVLVPLHRNMFGMEYISYPSWFGRALP